MSSKTQTWTYQRLKGKGRGFLTYQCHTLWRGPDHLLWVERGFSTERYKRFSYKDIQAIVISRTRKGQIWNIILSLFFVFFALLTWLGFETDHPGITIFQMIMAAAFLVPLVINTICGPTSRVHMQTAVQMEQLPSLNRLRTAQRVVNQIKALIEGDQGLFKKEQLATPIWGKVPQQIKVMNPEIPSAPTAVTSEGLHFHFYFFGVLALIGLAAFLCFSLKQIWTAMIGSGLILPALVLGIMSLVRQHKNGWDKALKTATWIGMVFVVLSCLQSYIFYMVASVRNPESAYNQWTLIKRTLGLYIQDNPAITVIHLITVTLGLGIGLFGLITARSNQAPKPKKPVTS